MKRLLVIDDEPGHRLMVRAVMEDSGWSVEEAGSGEEGLELLAQDRVNVVLLDMRMPGMDGQETLARIQDMYPGLPVVMLTAFGTVGSAVVAMKKGAFDYLTKPADNEELTAVLEKAWDFGRLMEENENLRRRLSDDDPTAPIVGASQAMCRVRDFIRQAGPSEATILIMGESGTGKELVAQALHDASNRAAQPLVKVNCAALPGHLLESELFGYMKGAFTGAVRDKPGRFQLARGGTLFLDEIGELPLELQSKLLRALQERVVEPLGAVRPVPVDVRIIAATNRDLKRAVEAGEFREDLFFRLNVLEVVSPPLRDRLEDLPMLAGRLLERLCRKNKKGIRSVNPEFLDAEGHPQREPGISRRADALCLARQRARTGKRAGAVSDSQPFGYAGPRIAALAGAGGPSRKVAGPNGPAREAREAGQVRTVRQAGPCRQAGQAGHGGRAARRCGLARRGRCSHGRGVRRRGRAGGLPRLAGRRGTRCPAARAGSAHPAIQAEEVRVDPARHVARQGGSMNRLRGISVLVALVVAATLVAGCSGKSMQASQLLEQGRYAEAATAYAQVAAEDPSDWQAGVRHGYALYRKGDHAAAQAVLAPLMNDWRAAQYARFWAGIAAIAARDGDAARAAWSGWTTDRFEVLRVVRPRVELLRADELALGPQSADLYAREAAQANALEEMKRSRDMFRRGMDRGDVPDPALPPTPVEYLP